MLCPLFPSCLDSLQEQESRFNVFPFFYAIVDCVGFSNTLADINKRRRSFQQDLSTLQVDDLSLSNVSETEKTQSPESRLCLNLYWFSKSRTKSRLNPKTGLIEALTWSIACTIVWSCEGLMTLINVCKTWYIFRVFLWNGLQANIWNRFVTFSLFFEAMVSISDSQCFLFFAAPQKVAPSFSTDQNLFRALARIAVHNQA